MSSKERNDGWATPKRAQSMEKGLQFMNLKPHDLTVVVQDQAKMKNGHASSYSKGSNSKLSYSNGDHHAQIYQQKSNGSHQQQQVLDGSHDGNLETSNQGYERYDRTYSATKGQFSPQLPPQYVGTKEELCDQKNLIIRKQKSIITQLRQTNMELEELLIQKKHELRSSNNERMQKHLREYQHDITLLKQQVAEARTAKATEIDKLQRQLGKSEYEFGKLEIALKEMEISKSGESGKIMKELKKKELELKSEQQKNIKIIQEIKTLKHQNTKLQTYLEELATAEELKDLQTELNNLKNEKEDQQMKYQMLEREINETKANCQEKEMDCQKLQLLNIEQRDELASLKSTVQKYRQLEETGGLSFEEQEDIVGENVRLRKENVELRLSLQKRQHKIDDLFKDTVQQKIQYEEQNVKVKDLMNQLHTEATEKGIALTQTAASNQEILSQSLKYQGELKQYKERYNDEFQRMLCNLGREMGFCIDDVKSFLNLCISRIKGDEPSLNSLLGLREPSDKNDSPPPVVDITYIKTQHKEMAELRKEIDDLRRLVSEHYAQEIGDNMCITQ